MNQDVFTLEEGNVSIQWPKALSKESYQDLEDWLELIKRKAKRAIIDQQVSRPQRVSSAAADARTGNEDEEE